jgi:hypothetical protein
MVQQRAVAATLPISAHAHECQVQQQAHSSSKTAHSSCIWYLASAFSCGGAGDAELHADIYASGRGSIVLPAGSLHVTSATRSHASGRQSPQTLGQHVPASLSQHQNKNGSHRSLRIILLRCPRQNGITTAE